MNQQLLDTLKMLFTFVMSLFKRKQQNTNTSWVPPIEDIAKQAVQNLVSIFFPAIYETQRNNKIAPGVTCAATSFSMLAQSLMLPEYGATYKIPRGWEDVLLEDVQRNWREYAKQSAKDTGNRYLANLGFEALREDFHFLAWYGKQKLGLVCEVGFTKVEPLYNRVVAGSLVTPWMMSTAKALTSFGHIVLGRGVFEDKSGRYFSVNDPFGTFPYGSKTNGEGVSYALSKWTTRDNIVTMIPVSWPGKK